jgi:hypothetical protein
MAEQRILKIPRLSLPDRVQPIAGTPGHLELLPIEQLRVDLTYQRTMSITSARLAQKIAATFDWRRFVPAIGVRNEDGTVSLVDGQHRTAAAKARGIEKVPVYVLDCTLSEAAAAFAAINGTVTPMSPQDIFRAQLAAGDAEARELQQALDVAGVVVVSHKNAFIKGETRSVNPLRRALRVYGRDLLILTLQCITETADGNAGLITGATVNGIAKALINKPELLAVPGTILDLFDSFNLKSVLQQAEIEYAQTGNPPQYVLTREVNNHLRLAVPQPLKKVAS